MTNSPHQRSLFDDLDDDDCGQDSPPPPSSAGNSAPEDRADSTESPAPPSLDGKTVYVIDAHSLIYQVFYALPEMSSSRGEPVGAVYGFLRDLIHLLEARKPDYFFCAFDMPGKTFRHELFTQYKANRPQMPDELVSQIASIHRLLDALRIPALAADSFEADDVLATVARMTEEMGGQCFLVTADKDCRQLITDRVVLYNIRKAQVFDRQALMNDWGIAPDQVADFQALVGDATDNVPGVPLIGPKFARQLLETYGSLEKILDHAQEVSGAKRRQNLIEAREQAMLSRKLTRLDQHMPISVDWEAGRTGGIDSDGARQLCHEFGFRSLGERIDALAGATPKPERTHNAEYHLVDTPEALAAFAADLGRQKRFAVDLETTHLWPRWAEIVGFAIAWKENEGWYLPVKAPPEDACLDLGHTLDTLRPLLEDPKIGKVGQNLKYDIAVLRATGVELAGVSFDTMVASYLLDAGQRNHSLDDLAKRYLKHTTTKISQLIGSGKLQKRMDQVPTREVADYAGEDAVLSLCLCPILDGKLQQLHLKKLFQDLELPLIEVLVELEFNGIQVDIDRLAQLSHEFGDRMTAAEVRIYDLAGRRFNIASPRQLQQVLFEELNLPVIKKTAKSGPSTDADVLEELAIVHPLPAEILEYRQYAKLKGTYVDALPKMVHPGTGRVHASFHQAVAATGRLSSSDPNLQNIPVRTDEGREIRSAFVAAKDNVLLCADYSQIELRVLAHFSQDATLCNAFAHDEDIHARVASQVYDVPLEQVTGEMRRKAKAVNFGVIYGQTAFGLAKQLRIEKKEAAEFIDAYFEGYPGIGQFLDQVLAECWENGYVNTILGRRRDIRGVRRDRRRQRNLAERTAVNTVIQGSAADLIKQAMIAIHCRLQRERLPAKMLLQIHDELIFEVPTYERDRLAHLVVEEMAGVQPLQVPLKIDVKAGRSWGDAEPWR